MAHPRPRPLRNPPQAAVRTLARLKSKAQSRGTTTDKLVVRYATERLLQRVFTAPGLDESVVLKGGMLMYLAEGCEPIDGRTTRDADLHAPNYGGTLDSFTAALAGALTREDADGVSFEGVEAARSREGLVEGGTITAWAHVGGAVARVSVDVTFDARGAALGSEAFTYRSLLGDAGFEARRVPWACVVADKLAAMIQHGAATTRMRDFYDLWAILDRDLARDEDVAVALAESLAVRGCAVPDDLEGIEALSLEAGRALAPLFERERDAGNWRLPAPEFQDIRLMLRARCYWIGCALPRAHAAA